MEFRFALAGDPVDHSLSPIMHRAAFAQAGLNGAYHLERCDADRFRRLVDDLRLGVWHGLNVTMPHKPLAETLCDETTVEGTSAGSVNILKSHDGRIVGHSTDAVVFRDLFRSGSFSEAPLLILGSGGSASAALAVASGSVFLGVRNKARAGHIAERFAAREIEIIEFGVGVENAVVINATPVGMAGESLPADVLRKAAALIDLPYGAKTTPAVGFARDNSIPVCDGIGFLSRQAAASFLWWTGVEVEPLGLDRAARNNSRMKQ